MKKILYGIGIIILLILIAGIIKFNFINDDIYVPDGKGNYVNNQGKIANFVDDEKQKDEDKKFEEEIDQKIKKDDNKIKVQNRKRMTVKIPKWEFSEKENDFKVEFFEYEVPYTKAVLGATLKKLFELRGGDENGNWNGMSFDSVSLKDGKAVIKLKGKWYPAGDMSGAYMAHEINAAVFQFSTVKSLEVWLNNEIFDWCWDDLSDGEGGCPEKKMLWIKNK